MEKENQKMIDPRERPKACEKCDKEDCPLYSIDEISGQEICMEYTAEEWGDKQ